MIDTLQTELKRIITEHYGVDVTPDFTRPDAQFGDLATNVAMRVGGLAGSPPRDVAEVLAETLRAVEGVDDVSIAGPGFINVRLTDQALSTMWSTDVPQVFAGQTVVAEYSDPNPFKVLHAGHLYTSIMGDAIANLVQSAGATVHRVNFGGDVGLHVGKTMWAIVHEFGGEYPEKLDEIAEDSFLEWIADRYVYGTNAYEENETTKQEIVAYNKRIYQLHSDDDHTSSLAQIYWKCREMSYEYFDAFYAAIGSGFERYYPESETAILGLNTVRQHIGDVYEESDGAIIYDGERRGLHTRVFINREGLPTYEAKDVGLALAKLRDYQFDASIIITGNDIVEYMKVVMMSINDFEPAAVKNVKHLTHGMVKLQGGVKMSSRKGNFLRAIDVLEAADQANTAQNQANRDVSLGAVKYSFLRQRMGGDIIYQPEESVSLAGNSGPYLQYAHARACSILSKVASRDTLYDIRTTSFDDNERALVRKLSEYPEILSAAVVDLMPHHLCNYLFELAQQFSRFYESSKVVQDEREAVRAELVRRYQATLAHGLSLLGIAAPEKL